MLLAGKVAVITGAASGIGEAAALVFAQEGAKVVCADLNAELGERVVDTIVGVGGQAKFVRCDVCEEQDVISLVKNTTATFGRLDCAFNNAGSPGPCGRLLTDYGVREFESTIAVNLRGLLLCLRHEISGMLAGGRGGSIVNTASIGGLGGWPTMSAYTAAKHGVVGLTRTAALDYARKGIRINALCPGSTRTPMLERVVGDSGLEDPFTALAASIPLGRLADPSEQAQAAAWLCSDRSSFITGIALPVDGGVSCHA